jgi:hypothetical protein
MTPEPLWAMADQLVQDRKDAALDKLLGGFRETSRHPTYGPYGAVGLSRLNARTHNATVIAAHLSGWGPVVWTQGGLNSASAASAKTHVGLGVEDIQSRGRKKDDIFDLISAGMLCGVVLFPRGIPWDNIADGMVEHCHGVTIGGSDKHPDARAQIYSTSYGYANGGAGLAGMPRARWQGPPRKALVSWEESKYNPANGWRP